MSWNKKEQRANIDELATIFGLDVTHELKAFYKAAYTTAVYDVVYGDEIRGLTQRIIDAQLLPKKKKKEKRCKK